MYVYILFVSPEGALAAYNILPTASILTSPQGAWSWEGVTGWGHPDPGQMGPLNQPFSSPRQFAGGQSK